jgi:hypothetical protein
LIGGLPVLMRGLRELTPEERSDHLNKDAHALLMMCLGSVRYRLHRAARFLPNGWSSEPVGGGFDPGTYPSELRRLASLLLGLASSYTPSPYRGRLTLFRAKVRGLIASGYPDLGWGALALGGVDVYAVPGTHTSVLTEPFVNVVARKVQACLDATETCALHRPPAPQAIVV